MDSQIVNFKLLGADFDNESYNLFYLVEGLACGQKLIEQSYLTLNQRSRMTDNDRKNLKIFAKDIRDGSFSTDLMIFIRDIAMPLLPAASGINPKEIWNLVISSYDFLKAVFTAFKSRREYTINIDGSPGALVMVENNGTVINAGRDVIECANKIHPHIEKLTDNIDDNKGFSGFSLKDNEEESKEVKLTMADKELFKNKEVLDNNEIKFKGIYSNATVSTFGGSIEVTNPLDSELVNGVYSFDFLNKDDERLFRHGFIEERTYTAFKKVKFDLSSFTEEVVGLRIIQVIE